MDGPIASHACEPHHEVYFREAPVVLGPMTGASWRWNPRRLGMMLARYKFVSKMLAGLDHVAEIGCADGFGSEVVRREVGRLDLYDRDERWATWIEREPDAPTFRVHDIIKAPIAEWRARYDAIYMLDVLEHIAPPQDEVRAMRNISASLTDDGIFIAGCPSLEGQQYARETSKVGHVNCKTGDKLRADAREWFRNVFLFSMNDEVVHTGFSPMSHYNFILCTGPRGN